EDVDRAESAERELHEALAAFRCREVGRDRKDVAIAGPSLDLFGGRGDRRLLATAERDPAAFAGELLGDGASEPLRGRRDESRLSLEAEVHAAIVPPRRFGPLGR